MIHELALKFRHAWLKNPMFLVSTRQEQWHQGKRSCVKWIQTICPSRSGLSTLMVVVFYSFWLMSFATEPSLHLRESLARG